MTGNTQGLHFDMRVDETAWNNSLQHARSSMNNFVQDVEQGGQKIDDTFKKIGTSIGAYFAVDKLVSFAKSIFDVHSEMQQLQTSFDVLIGNEAKSAKLMEDMRTFAVSTPMQLEDLTKAAQTMLGFGIEVEKIMPNLKALGDISMSDSSKFQSLSLAFSQMSATGKLMGQDLLQMINAGFNPLTEISRKTGKSVGELKEEMSKGAISAEMVAEAFQSAAGEGGKFNGMLEKQSKGLKGAYSNLQGAWKDALDEMGGEAEGVFSGVIDAATFAVKNLDKLVIAVGTAALVWGEYKASLMLVHAAQQTASEGMTKFNAEAVNNIVKQFGGEDIANETAQIEANTQAKRNNAIADNEQIKALQQKLALKVQEAQVELDSATKLDAEADDKVAKAKEEVDAASERVSAAQQQYQATMSEADSERLLSAEKDLAIAKDKLETAEEAKNATAKAVTDAQNKKSAASEKANALATAVDTAATKANSKAKAFLAGMIGKATKAMHALKAAFMSNPFGMALMAITTLIGALGVFNDKTQETSAEIERFGESAVKQMRNIETLFAVIDNTNVKSNVHKQAIDELIEIYAQYGYKIDDEIDKLEQLKQLHDNVTKAIQREGEERKKANLLESYNQAEEEAEKKFKEAIGINYFE